MIPFRSHPQYLGMQPLVLRVVFPAADPLPPPAQYAQRALGCWRFGTKPHNMWSAVRVTINAGLPVYMVSTHNNVPIAAYRIVDSSARAPVNHLVYDFGGAEVQHQMCSPEIHANHAGIIGVPPASFGTLFQKVQPPNPRLEIYLHGVPVSLGFLNGQVIGNQYLAIARYFLLPPGGQAAWPPGALP